MNFMQIINLPSIFYYISGIPFFWASMGLITAIGIFIGSLLYNGDLKNLTKGVLTLSVYTGLLATTNINRVYIVFMTEGITDSSKALAGTFTAVITLMFYILGMVAGVLITRKIRNENKPKSCTSK